MDQPAGREILDHGAIAVQEDQGLAFSLLDIMQANSINLDELANGRVAAFRSGSQKVVDDTESDQGDGAC